MLPHTGLFLLGKVALQMRICRILETLPKKYPQMPLTGRQIKNAKPAAKAYKLADGRGLYLQITPAGGKLWRWKYRIGGKEKLLSIGEYPLISLLEARESQPSHSCRLPTGYLKKCDPYPEATDALGRTTAGVLVYLLIYIFRCATLNANRYLEKGIAMQTAKLFTNGRSQAVRLPAAFRFEGDTVYIRRDENGDVVLSAKPADWQGFNAAARELAGEGIERAQGSQERDVFADWQE